MNYENRTRVLILGVSGMLGSAIYRTLCRSSNLSIFGTARSCDRPTGLPVGAGTIITNIHPDSEKSILNAFSEVNPQIVINCIGIIKQRSMANDCYESVAINSLLPHRLARYCSIAGARLIHFSTDCVFSGRKGQYVEADFADADDIYGRTKLLGEVYYPNSITLRTSIIGHELTSNRSLVDWFLGQVADVKGYQKAIFSGLPTIEVAKVVRDLIIPNESLSGLYHLSVDSISKYHLLSIIKDIYGTSFEILPDRAFVIDRSLNSDRFQRDFNFTPKNWPDLIREMHEDYLSCRKEGLDLAEPI